MNAPKIYLLALIATICFAGIPTASGKGLLGERYVEGNVGFLVPGDDFLRDNFDTFLTLGGSVNVPLTCHLDLFFKARHRTADATLLGVPVDADITTLLSGTTYHFAPRGTCDPFVGFGMGVHIQELQSPVLSDEKTDFYSEIFFGMEIDLNERVTVTPILNISNVEDEHVKAKLRFNHWLSSRVFNTVTIGSALDEGDFFLQAGLGVAF